jgi:hypothetical protein
MPSFIGDSSRKAPKTSSWPRVITPSTILIGATGTCAECLEFVGIDNLQLYNLVISGGVTGIRLNDCQNFTLTSLFINGTTKSDPDANGQGIQVINSSGVIDNCEIVATTESVDLISIFGDMPQTELLEVKVWSNRLYGRGQVDFGNGVCVDGNHPPRTQVSGNRGRHNRCMVTIAGGSDHVVKGNTSIQNDTDLYVEKGYDKPPRNVRVNQVSWNILEDPNAKGAIVYANA